MYDIEAIERMERDNGMSLLVGGSPTDNFTARDVRVGLYKIYNMLLDANRVNYSNNKTTVSKLNTILEDFINNSPLSVWLEIERRFNVCYFGVNTDNKLALYRYLKRKVYRN